MDFSEKIGSLKDYLRSLIARHDSICLWLSGGSDSRLLLEAMLESRKPFGILRFDDGWSKKQKEIINAVVVKHNLQVFSYPPKSFFLFGENSELSLAAFYAVDFAGNSVPIVRDIVQGSRCAFDVKIKAASQSFAPIEFDAHVWGTRFEDAHYSFDARKVLRREQWAIGEKKFFAPLADWTRAEVLQGLESFGVEYEAPTETEDTGNISACHSCLATTKKVFCPKTNAVIDGVKWDKTKNLELFRRGFVTGEENEK